MKTFRVLLPGHMRDGSLLPWKAVAELCGYTSAVDGYTEWSHLTELRPGRDSGKIPRVAAGIIDEGTANGLARGFVSISGDTWKWDPDAVWDSFEQRAIPRPQEFHRMVTFRELLDRWKSWRLMGVAYTSQATIEAPPFADSLLASVDEFLVDDLTNSGLEIYPVSRLRQINIWSD